MNDYDKRYEERLRDEAQREYSERWTRQLETTMPRREWPSVGPAPPMPEPPKKPEGA